ncbi:RNA polymerase sigma factor [Arthrobacter rhombi]|uniref:RNA polymerase sigma factor n=1 Tax=Arthrobacter rhombi TaxID=71253 RepID=UPI003FCF2CED
MKNKQAFETVVQRHGRTVLRVCRAVLGAGADADDAWSETFLAALQAWPEIDEETNMQAWLVTVAHRKAIDVTRTRARQGVPAEYLPEPASAWGNPGTGEPELWAAVGQLPTRQRLAVAYYYFGGMKHTETAELIGGTAEAVRRAAADGLNTLRRTYGADAFREGTLK